MIQFFRKIRIKLIRENNFKKYSAYAIGEILLVMIGILLALQINNWNTKRIEKGSKFLLTRISNVRLTMIKM